jgi:hypothetical protein
MEKEKMKCETKETLALLGKLLALYAVVGLAVSMLV